jgi:methylated-DNA-[protein]-cysteine S-methyltransferase
MTQHYQTTLESPIGQLLAVAERTTYGASMVLTHLHMLGGKHAPKFEVKPPRDDGLPIFAQLRAELREYFDGRRKGFGVALDPRGTAFQKSVWHTLMNVPYGETRTYKEQAVMLGNVLAVRAVGTANGKNPIGILIPCHRIIGAKGELTGYAGGLHNKEHLLRLEGALLL